MTRRRGARAKRSPAIGMVRAVLLGSFAASCVLSEVTIVPLPGDGGEGGTKPNSGGAGGKSPAAAGDSNGIGAAGDTMAEGGGGANTAGTNTAGSSQAGVDSGGSPSTGGQSEGGAGGGPVVDPDSGPFQVLVVSATGPVGYVHPTIANAVALVDELGQTEDAALPSGAKPGSQFETTLLATPAEVETMTPEFLAGYRVLFFAHTTGDLFSSLANGADIMAAIEAFMNDGGGWVGIHATIELELASGSWPWCQDNLTGSLPGLHSQAVPDDVAWTADAIAANHPVIRDIPTAWACKDEWYALDRDPSSAGFSILGTRASTLVPVLWAKELDAGGRSVFTPLGHDVATYSDANFKKLMLQSILWAANRME